MSGGSLPEPEPRAIASVLRLWGPALAFMAAIFGLSSMSAPPSPANVSDKLEHFVAYGVLALLTLRATSGGRWAGVSWTAVAVAWCIAVGYGISDEFHQSFVPGRTADPADVAADAVGAATALIGAGAFGIILRSRRAIDAPRDAQ